MTSDLFLKSAGAALALALVCVTPVAAQDGPPERARTIVGENLEGDNVASDGAAAAKPAFTKLASHVISEQGDEFNPSSITCYFVNVGKKFVRLKDIELFHRDDGKLVPSANSCGDTKGTTLAPGRSCFVGAPANNSFYFCSALVDDRASVRASFEVRDGAAKVLRSTELTAGTGKTSGDAFETLATPAMFGAPNPRAAACQFTNVGSKPAKYRKLRIVRFDGTSLPTVGSDCGSAKSGFVKPNETCNFSVQNPGSFDVHCRVEVTRKADFRGAMRLQGDYYEILNVQPMR